MASSANHDSNKLMLIYVASRKRRNRHSVIFAGDHLDNSVTVFLLGVVPDYKQTNKKSTYDDFSKRQVIL